MVPGKLSHVDLLCSPEEDSSARARSMARSSVPKGDLRFRCAHTPDHPSVGSKRQLRFESGPVAQRAARGLLHRGAARRAEDGLRRPDRRRRAGATLGNARKRPRRSHARRGARPLMPRRRREGRRGEPRGAPGPLRGRCGRQPKSVHSRDLGRKRS